MATIDLGKIKQVFRGTYNNATAYAVDDLVAFTDGSVTSTYICTTASTGNNPSSGGTAHANWAYVAKGVADPIPTQSGQSGKYLTTNGSALSFGTVTQAVKKFYTKRDGARHSVNTVVTNNSYTSMWEWGNLTQTITPQSNASKFHITGMLSIHHYSDYEGNGVITYQPSGGTETAVTSNSQTNFRRTFRGSAGGNTGSNMMSPTAIDIMMEPNTASAVTFRIRLATTNSGKPWFVNRDADNTTNTSDGGGVLSSWTITEVDGAQVTIASTDVDYYTS